MRSLVALLLLLAGVAVAQARSDKGTGVYVEADGYGGRTRVDVPRFAAVSVAWQRAAFPDPPSVVDVDLGSYMGRWYEVARTRVSTPFQALCGCVTADYELLDSGNVRVVNTCVKMPHPLIQGATTQAIGEAVPKAPGKLLVTFDGQPASFMADEGNYWIVDSADDGSWAVVSSMMRAPIWVLSRTPALPGGTLKDIMQRLTDRGFDAWKLRPTTQGDSCAYT